MLVCNGRIKEAQVAPLQANQLSLQRHEHSKTVADVDKSNIWTRDYCQQMTGMIWGNMTCVPCGPRFTDVAT